MEVTGGEAVWVAPDNTWHPTWHLVPGRSIDSLAFLAAERYGLPARCSAPSSTPPSSLLVFYTSNNHFPAFSNCFFCIFNTCFTLLECRQAPRTLRDAPSHPVPPRTPRTAPCGAPPRSLRSNSATKTSLTPPWCVPRRARQTPSSPAAAISRSAPSLLTRTQPPPPPLTPARGQVAVTGARGVAEGTGGVDPRAEGARPGGGGALQARPAQPCGAGAAVR